MIRMLAVLAAFVLGVGSWNGARADDKADCFGSQLKPEQKIPVCTTVIGQMAADKNTQAVAYFNRGQAQMRLRQYRSCIDDYSEGLKHRTSDGLAFFNRGNCHANLKELDQAIANYRSAMEVDPNNAGWSHELSWMYVLKRDYPRAIEGYTETLRIDPTFSPALVERGDVYQNLQEWDKAIADYDKAIALKPSGLRSYLRRGSVYAVKGDRQRAVADFEQVIALPASSDTDKQLQDIAKKRLTNLDSAPKTADGGAVPPTGPEKRIALVIGNSAYEGQSVLANPANDAKAIAAKLKSIGFQKVIEAVNLDLKKMSDALKDFGDLAQDADWAVIFYAGHGIEVGGINYLIPTDAKLQRDSHVRDEAISLDRVLDKVEGARRLRLVILDACRNNPFAARMARAGSTRSIGRGLGNLEPDSGILVIYAAKHGNTALDGDGANSPFTQAMLQYMDESGTDLMAMVGKVRQAVLKSTKNSQEPWLYGAPSPERFYFKK